MPTFICLTFLCDRQFGASCIFLLRAQLTLATLLTVSGMNSAMAEPPLFGMLLGAAFLVPRLFLLVVFPAK